MERTRTWQKAEPFLFLLIVLITAVPVLTNLYFPTVDGPAHLHNANLLKHYWFYNERFLLNFFDLNKHLNSNFVDHVWFAVFGLFLPAYLVEKSILLFYLFSLPYAFRYLVKKIANGNSARLSVYLIFPFIYSFTFRIGFFNFCIGIPVLFWTLGYWIKHRESLTRKKIIWLSFLTTLIYASHIFNFMLLGIILLCNELQYILREGKTNQLVRKLRPLFWIFLPGLILSALFFISNSSFDHSPPTYLPKARLTQAIIDISPAITLNYENEIGYTRILGCAMCLLIAFTAFFFFKNRKKENTSFRPLWIFSAIIVLILFYIFPDWIASGGFISIRWALYFFLVLIILIAAADLRPVFLIVPITVILVNHLFFIRYHDEQTAFLSDDAETLADAEQYMEENTVLLPLSYSTNWMQINHAGYMATQKNIINLDNYEPTKPHFPLLWKKGEQVYDLMPKYGNRYPPCINIENYELKTHHRIDYLSRFCFNGDVKDSCTALVEQEIKNKFDLIYTSANNKLVLYKRKPGT